jgi:chloramphenicol-sensitive protein RarD
LSEATLMAFMFIWAGLAVYTLDAVLTLRRG